MPINLEWKDMIRSMGKSYKKGTTKCRDLSDGSKICVSEEAWSMFFATGTKRYGAGFDSKPRPKNTEESFVDDIVKWYLGEKKW